MGALYYSGFTQSLWSFILICITLQYLLFRDPLWFTCSGFIPPKPTISGSIPISIVQYCGLFPSFQSNLGSQQFESFSTMLLSNLPTIFEHFIVLYPNTSVFPFPIINCRVNSRFPTHGVTLLAEVMLLDQKFLCCDTYVPHRVETQSISAKRRHLLELIATSSNVMRFPFIKTTVVWSDAETSFKEKSMGNTCKAPRWLFKRTSIISVISTAVSNKIIQSCWSFCIR